MSAPSPRQTRPPWTVRSSFSRSLDLALALVVVAALLLGGIYPALLPPADQAVWAYLLYDLVFLVYVAAGVLAWWRRPSNRMGLLIVIGGFALYLGGLANTDAPVLASIGTVFATLVLSVIIHLLHAFPSGRLRGRASKATVLVAYGTGILLQPPLYLFNPAAPPQLFLADRPDLLFLGLWTQRAVSTLIVIATVVILVSRLRRADRAQRRVLGPLFTYGVLTVLFIPFSSSVLESILHVPPLVRDGMQLVVVAGVPIAFALGVLRGGFARTSELQELGAWLGTTDGGRPALAAALSHTLGDPGLLVVFWAADHDGYLSSDGTPALLPDASSVVTVELGGRRVGAIVYDSELIADAELVRTAGRIVAIAVDRERLTAELLASEHALRTSRTRLVDAAERERRRIARDLHDGVQMQLVLLALEAQRVANAPGATDDTQRSATALRVSIDAAASDLRQLVHDVMPATLIERGLSAAAEDLVDRMPVPTRLELGVTDGSLPASIESTAYFVLAEGLTNAVKHSEAGSLLARLVREGDLLLVEVHDDGVGGASLAGGTGLSGLADRVDVVGGRLRVESEPGRGTRLLVELPCG